MLLKNKLLDIFYLANQRFLKRNMSNIINNISERSLCASLSCEINKILELSELYEYYCDVEYNRNGHEVKAIIDDECKIIKIQNDLIIHSRGTKIKDNLLALEMKKSTSSSSEMEDDRNRLKCLTKQTCSDIFSYNGLPFPKYVCKYELGIFYIIDIKAKTITIEIYTNSALVNIETNTFDYFMNYKVENL